MIIPLLVTTFSTVFLAELGDKTQLATVTLSSTTNKPIAVFLGSASALVLASLLGVIAGGSISAIVPGNVLKILAAIGLLVIGMRLLWPLLVKVSNDLRKQSQNLINMRK